MTNEIITNELTNQILQVLEKNMSLRKESITFEIQDDGQCVMIYIPVDEFPDSEWPSTFQRVGGILSEIVPGRHGDYSWFATFTVDANIVDSRFGGNLDFPNEVF